jgi:hypothetical protein
MLHDVFLVNIVIWALLYAVGMWALLLVCYFAGWAHPLMVIYAPLLPLEYVESAIHRVRAYIKRRRVLATARWLVQNLRVEGISVHGDFGKIKSPWCDGEMITAEGESLGRCQVYAEVPEHLVIRYGEVYARAIAKFVTNDFTVDHICSCALPQTPLNHEWAQRYGFRKYFARPKSMPCEDCGAVDFLVYRGLLWADEGVHNHGQPRVVTYFLANRQERFVKTYLCQACEAKLHATGSISCAEF